MLVPFQRLLYCFCQEQGILLAASGHQIFSFGASDGRLLSTWVHTKQTQSHPLANNGGVLPGSPTSQIIEPPEKRRKIAQDDASEASSAEIVTENGKKHRRKRQKPLLSAHPSIINLCGTKDGRHVVAVTGEDKCIHVLQLLNDGRLEQHSERMMPKRPSAITLTTDQQTILCADKFGDVYSLPLLPSPVDSETGDQSPSTRSDEADKQTWKPAASSLTVHSKKNREALRHQQNQMSQPRSEEKKKIGFAHQLLLGHVSLLTDIASVALQTRQGQREYIATADRDEHIRISRGLPQAYIIERFCLGHSQFVSKMCFPSWRPEILVSGGGDDHLICWDWTDGAILQKIELRSEWQRIRDKFQNHGHGADRSTDASPAVSGIWSLQTATGAGRIIVACERWPALLTFKLGAKGGIETTETIEVGHNALDVAVDSRRHSIICSLDTMHAPCTQSFIEDGIQSQGPQVVVRRLSDSEEPSAEEEAGFAKAINAWAQQQGSPDPSSLGWLSELYYGIEHLRKQNVED